MAEDTYFMTLDELNHRIDEVEFLLKGPVTKAGLDLRRTRLLQAMAERLAAPRPDLDILPPEYT